MILVCHNCRDETDKYISKCSKTFQHKSFVIKAHVLTALFKVGMWLVGAKGKKIDFEFCDPCKKRSVPCADCQKRLNEALERAQE